MDHFSACTRTERSTWGKWNPFTPRVNNLDLAVKIIYSCSKRKMHCWQIIHLTQKINLLPQVQYIWFQTIFVLRQEDFYKRIFLLPTMDHLSACIYATTAQRSALGRQARLVWESLYIYPIYVHTLRILFFTIPWPKVPLSLPALKRECGIFGPGMWPANVVPIFGPGMMKNRIRNMGVKRATPEHMFTTRAKGERFTRALNWPTLYLPCCVIIYYF